LINAVFIEVLLWLRIFLKFEGSWEIVSVTDPIDFFFGKWSAFTLVGVCLANLARNRSRTGS